MKARIAVVLVLTAVFVVVALWGIEPEKVAVALAGADWPRIAGAVGCYLVAHTLRAARLGLLVGGGVPYRRLFSINTVGFLAINVVPMRLGEAVRPWLLAEREGVPWGRGIAGIVLERLLDMSMLLVMLLGLAWVVELPAGGVVVQGVDVVRAAQGMAGFLVGAGAVAGGLVVAVGEPAIRLIEKLPLGAKVAGLARTFREGFVALLREPLKGLAGLALSAGIWVVTVFAVWLTMTAFPEIPASLSVAWTTWAVTISGMTAVPTAGFFGIYEACCAAALALWSVEPTVARTFALVLHLSQFGFIVGLGGVFLGVEGVSLRDLVRQPSSGAADADSAS